MRQHRQLFANATPLLGRMTVERQSTVKRQRRSAPVQIGGDACGATDAPGDSGEVPRAGGGFLDEQSKVVDASVGQRHIDALLDEARRRAEQSLDVIARGRPRRSHGRREDDSFLIAPAQFIGGGGDGRSVAQAQDAPSAGAPQRFNKRHGVL